MFCCVLEVVITVATSAYHVYFIVVPSKVFDSTVDTRFGFLRRNRFLPVTNLSRSLCRKLVKCWKNSCVILKYVRNFRSIWDFSSEPVKCLEKIRLYGLFCFDRFCLFYFALPLLLCWMNFFDPLMSSSFMQCPEVLRMIVAPLKMLIFIVH